MSWFHLSVLFFLMHFMIMTALKNLLGVCVTTSWRFISFFNWNIKTFLLDIAALFLKTLLSDSIFFVWMQTHTAVSQKYFSALYAFKGLQSELFSSNSTSFVPTSKRLSFLPLNLRFIEKLHSKSSASDTRFDTGTFFISFCANLTLCDIAFKGQEHQNCS